MDSIEKEILDEEYDGFASRDARLRRARDEFFEGKQAREARELATAAVIKKEEEEEAERQRKRLEAAELRNAREKTSREVFVEEELQQVRQAVPQSELKSCTLDMVQVDLTVTNYRKLTIKMRFPDRYPEEGLVIEILSRTLASELLLKLKEAGEKESRKHIGECQVVFVVTLVRAFLESNRMATAYEDMQQIRELFANTQCTMKSSKEKTGAIHIVLREQAYFLDIKLDIPKDYPEQGVETTLNAGNLPPELQRNFIMQVNERAKRLAEPPKVPQASMANVGREGAGTGRNSKSERLSQNQGLSTRKQVAALQESAEETRRRAKELQRKMEAEHVVRPSVFPVVKYLWESCLVPLATSKCMICNKRLIPGDPNNVGKIPKDMTTLRLYCGHMYHFKCVEDFVSVPPFGKACKTCGKAIQHNKLVTDPKVLEQRWVHKQAREREMADVADFMS